MTALDADPDQLAALPSSGLAEVWQRQVDGACPKVSPRLLRLALAHSLQSKRLGGLSARDLRRLSGADCGTGSGSAMRPGTRLMRAWNGTTHVVVVGEDGVIQWNGQSWSSLSAVARAITGTRWSGPAFFGLRKPS